MTNNQQTKDQITRKEFQKNQAELVEIMKCFERDVKNFANYRLDKEDRSLWAKGCFYQQGQLNELFKFYRCGVALGKCLERLDGEQ